MKTALADRLGLDLPIIQAPMAGTSTPEQAAAVSNAGGAGLHLHRLRRWLWRRKPETQSAVCNASCNPTPSDAFRAA